MKLASSTIWAWAGGGGERSIVGGFLIACIDSRLGSAGIDYIPNDLMGFVDC